MKIHRTKILGFALLLAGLALCATGLWLLLSPPQYQATVQIRIEPQIISDIGLSGPARDSSVYDPYFIQVEFEVIQSQVVLSKVVDALNLNVEWGKSYARGSQLKTVDTVRLLRRRMNSGPVRNSKLLVINVTSQDPDEAAKIANAIGKAYREFRIEQRRQLTLNGIQVLTEQYQKEEEQLHEVQTNVNLLRNKFSATLTSVGPSPSWSLNQYTNRLIEYQKLQTRVAQMQAMSRAERRVSLPTIFLDSVLSNLWNRRHELEQTIARMTNNYSPADTSLQLQVQFNELNRQIDERADGIMSGLEDYLKSEKMFIKGMTNGIQEVQKAQKEEETKGAEFKSYQEEELKLEEMLKFHKLLKAKIESEKADLDHPGFSTVEIIEAAIPPQTPAGPNRLLGVFLLTMGIASSAGGFFLLKPSGRQSV